MGLKKFFQQLRTDLIVVGLVGLIAGAIIVLAIRFFSYSPEMVHYHANFSVYLNGQREQFNMPAYYEEESALACSVAEAEEMSPGERAHMHDNVNDVVHVEDDAVTWGQFFQNLGWTINPKLVQTRTQVLMTDDSHKVSFILNGKSVDNITDKIIGDRDRLLVDYGDSSSQALQSEFNHVASTAQKYDTTQDPKSCSGHKAAQTSDRLHHLF